MERQGEPTYRGRTKVVWAVVVAALSVPFLVGAGAPAAVRWAMPQAAPPPAASYALPERQPEERAAEVAISPSIIGVESLSADSPLRPPEVQLPARISDLPPARGERAIPPPTLRPGDPGWVARRLEIPALGVNVSVAMAPSTSAELFPPFDGAYILRSSAQPGRGTNSYLFAHAMPNLFKPLWGATIGQQVIVTMSDGQQLSYRVTAVVRDIPCPDPSAHKPAGLPPALAYATECDLSWTLPTPTERLTMQTSQGFNRNYGEMVVIAEPDWGR